MNLKLYLTILLLHVCANMALAISENQKKSVVEQLIQTFSQDKIFYRSEPNYFMAQGMLNSGRLPASDYMSIQMSGKIEGSFLFASDGSDPHFLEMKVAKGTRYIDLTEEATLQVLKQNGITPQEVIDMRPNSLVKSFSLHDWWNVYSADGITVRKFSGEGLSSEKIIGSYYQINPVHAESSFSFRSAAEEVLKQRAMSEPQLIEALPYKLRLDHVKLAKSPGEIIELMKVNPKYLSDILADSQLSHMQILDEFFKRKPGVEEMIQFSKTPMIIPQMEDLVSRAIYNGGSYQDISRMLKEFKVQLELPGRQPRGYKYLIQKIYPQLKPLNPTPAEIKLLADSLMDNKVRLMLHQQWPQAQIYSSQLKCTEEVLRTLLFK